MSKVSVIVPVYNVENYIRDMLLSVQKQTFKDFEVILINDGSPDNSQDIIDEFCDADKRFKSFVQENSGVAAARNNGISKASGDYLVFYDPDDYIPADALEKMYKVASKNNSDMVIGIMEEKSLGESLIYMHSQALAKQDEIHIMDVHFTGAWSLCHKMFKRTLIVDNNIKFEKLTNAEDGVFTYCCLNHATKINGCKVVAYNYMKRPFWLEASATQTISSKYLEGLLASHNRILEEAMRLADKHLDSDAKEKYLQNLFVRFIEGEMIKGYYRNIWRADEDIITRIAERTVYYRQFITEKQWKEILSRHTDLELEKGYMMPEDIAKIPTVSILVSADVDATKLDLILGSIYNQQFQRFEVLLPAKYENVVDDVCDYFRNKITELENLGIEDYAIDPGFGFSKTLEQNYELLGGIDKLTRLGAPILVGVSRKSMIYKALDTTADQSLSGTIALGWEALRQGAKILRVHDVREAADTVRLWNIYQNNR